VLLDGGGEVVVAETPAKVMEEIRLSAC